MNKFSIRAIETYQTHTLLLCMGLGHHHTDGYPQALFYSEVNYYKGRTAAALICSYLKSLYERRCRQGKQADRFDLQA